MVNILTGDATSPGKLILCLILTDRWPEFFQNLTPFLPGIPLLSLCLLFSSHIFILDHVDHHQSSHVTSLCLLFIYTGVCTCRWPTLLMLMCQRRIRSKLWWISPPVIPWSKSVISSISLLVTLLSTCLLPFFCISMFWALTFSYLAFFA